MGMPFPADYFSAAAAGYYPSDLAPPLVDHLHQRPLPHQHLWGFLTHRKPNLQAVISQPDLDIRSSDSGYIIDIELPGVGDKNSVRIEWTSSRSLVVSGSVERPSVPGDMSKPEGVERVKKTPDGTRGVDGGYIAPRESEDLSPTLVIAERRIGPFHRHFNFPVDVDMEKLKAGLENGLLVINVPKKATDVGSCGRIGIE